MGRGGDALVVGYMAWYLFGLGGLLTHIFRLPINSIMEILTNIHDLFILLQNPDGEFEEIFFVKNVCSKYPLN